MISDDLWAFTGALFALLCVQGCWWLGFRWRSFSILVGCTVLGAAIWRLHCDWTTAPDYSDRELKLIIRTIIGGTCAGGLCLGTLLAHHVVRRFTQSRHLRSILLRLRGSATTPLPFGGFFLVGSVLIAGSVLDFSFGMPGFVILNWLVTSILLGVVGFAIVLASYRFAVIRFRSSPSDDDGGDEVRWKPLRSTLSSVLERLEQKHHLKYAAFSRATANEDHTVYEDWHEADDDPEHPSDGFLLVPHRTRIRYSPDGLPNLSNSFDVIILQREDDNYRATTASSSPFCERIMSRISATNSTRTPVR